MILQALCQYYDALARRGEVIPPGWSVVRVSFALELDDEGNLCQLIPLKVRPADGKKELPRAMRVPEQVKKTSGIAANFLCENSSYFLGVDQKGDPARARRCFEAAKALHEQLLSGCNTPAARAVCAYFARWQPEQAALHPALTPYLEEIGKGANLVFSVGGAFVQEDAAVQAAWNDHRAAGAADRAEGLCLVTGRRGAIARLHPAFKGVQGAQATGASLVSFNAPAYESYGHEQADGTGQGLNSPVSEEAAFQYGAALSSLIADREHLQYIGDTAVVFWAEDAEPAYRNAFEQAVFGSRAASSPVVTDADLKSAVANLASGRPVDLAGVPLNPQNRFFVLGLAPNAARLSVRFFLQNTYGAMLANVQSHYERLRITGPNAATGAPTLWRLLNETVNQNSRDKKPAPPMAAAVVRAILTGGSYPVSLLEQTLLRIRAERNVTPGRAAILKAVFLKNQEFHVPKEVLQVELNDQSNYLPYVLGRLFAVLERVQTQANPSLNATIKDKYFNSAAATPAPIFPLLTKLAQSHLRKLQEGSRFYYEGVIRDLENRIHETLPNRLALADQGVFHLGYYHQTQKFYEKRDKGGNENV